MLASSRHLGSALQVPIRLCPSFSRSFATTTPPTYPTTPGNELPHMNFRNFVDQLRKDGDLVDINMPIDANLEVGAITRKVYEKQEKAPLFNNVIGVQQSMIPYKMLGAPGGLRGTDPATSHRRVAAHFGIPPTSSIQDIQDKVLSAKTKPPIKPNVQKTGPCKENIILGDKVDMTNLVAPLLHTSDGGKYLQTYGLNVVESPDKTWTNWSIARGHVLSGEKNKFLGPTLPRQHIRELTDMWRVQKHRDCPWALALGSPPAAVMVGSMPLPDGITEPDYIGALTGIPIDVVKCETNDLYVPANAEIVLEGYMSATEANGQEGPMGEMHGYCFPGHTRSFPKFTVTAVTFRNDPILPVSVAGRMVDETHTLIANMSAAEALDACRKYNLPVKACHMPYETHVVWLVLQIDLPKLQAMNTTPADFVKLVGDVFFYKNRAGTTIHNILLVDDTVDVFNFTDVIWAYSTRCRPGMQQYLFDDVWGFSLIPFMSQGPGDPNTGGRMISDCLFPAQYKGTLDYEVCNFDKGYSQAIRDKINSNWNKMGFESKP